MDNKNFKINNKLAFFDFDRTLIVHDYSPEYIKNRENYFMECLCALTSLDEEHKNDKPLPCMQWYMRKLFEEGYGIFCLTHEIFNLRDQLKQEQLAKFYPGIPVTYLTVDSPDHKIDMMMAIAAAEQCRHSDVLFIDDRVTIVNKAINAGIDGKHLSDIVLLYENREVAEEEPHRIIKPKGFPEALGLSGTDIEKTYEECIQMIENGMGMEE